MAAPSSNTADAMVQRTFRHFVQSVRNQDFATFAKLHQSDARPHLEEDLFRKNAKRAVAHKFQFRLREIAYEGDVAEVTFEVIPGDGASQHRDEATLVMVREGDVFLIVES
jgi:ketosteroid isomerase-like protein